MARRHRTTAVLLALALLIAACDKIPLVVTDEFLGDWKQFGSGTAGFVAGPGEAPRGIGSLRLENAGGGTAGLALSNYDTRSLELVHLHLQTYHDAGGVPPALVVYVDTNDDGTPDDVYHADPVLQGAAADEWTQIDPHKWWALSDLTDTEGPADVLTSWSTLAARGGYIAEGGGIQVVLHSDAAAVGYADLFEFEEQLPVGENPVWSYDFEPAPGATTVVRSAAAGTEWTQVAGGSGAGLAFRAGPSPTPRGSGSAELTVGTTGTSAGIATTAFNGRELGDLRTARFWSRTGHDVCLAPSLILQLDTDDDGFVDLDARYAPCEQFRPYPGEPSEVQRFADFWERSVWQEWETVQGLWFDGTEVLLFRDLQAAHPTAVIRGLRLQALGQSGVATQVDALTVAFVGDETPTGHDFEAAVGTGPAPGSGPVTPPPVVHIPGAPVVALPGQTVTTDPGTGATPDSPLQASVTTPTGGTVQIEVSGDVPAAPAGFSLLGMTVDITAPDATAEDPLVLGFEIDASLVPSGVRADNLAVFRNGELVPDCRGPAGVASPDPCVAERSVDDDGDLHITVLTSRASQWSFGYALGVAPVASTACEQGAPAAGFADVGQGNVHRLAIDCVTYWRIANGISAELYNPAGQVTRAQMASFLTRLVLESGGTLPPASSGFKDTAGNTHEEAIGRLAAAEIVRGTSTSSYDPGAPVTREQMASFLVRTYQHVAGSVLPPAGDRFTDITWSAHRDAINQAAAAGFTTGRTADSYAPAEDVRRDQMASFLVRMLNRLVEEGFAQAR